MKESQEGLTDIQKKIILLASVNNTPITGKTWLQNELFLLSEAIDDFGKETNYVPCELGPFSDPVKNGLEYLINSRIISMDDNKICLTSKGKHIAKGLEFEEDPATIELLMDCKNFFNDLTMDELLCYISLAYPKMTEKPKVYLEIEDFLLDLVQREKISMGRAANLMEKSISHVIKRLNERGHQVLQ